MSGEAAPLGLWRAAANDICMVCDDEIVGACLPCEFKGCGQHMDQHARHCTVPPPTPEGEATRVAAPEMWCLCGAQWPCRVHESWSNIAPARDSEATRVGRACAEALAEAVSPANVPQAESRIGTALADARKMGWVK